jgi:hypothetical protein
MKSFSMMFKNYSIFMMELCNRHSRFAKAGVSCFYDSEVLNLKFSSSYEIQWLKSLPAYS